MLDTLTLTLTSTSTRQRTTVPDASAKKEVFIFGADGASPFSWQPPFVVSSPRVSQAGYSEAYETMLASEQVLSRDWDDPEEDALWADL